VPSFDIVSEVSRQEISNAVNNANREVERRFDFKGTDAKFELDGNDITMRAPSEFQLKQMFDILTERLSTRKVDVRCLRLNPPQVNVSQAWQLITVRQGIEAELAKRIVKLIKDQKLKVQPAIQGDQVRVSAKNRDQLQEVIAMVKNAKLNMPLQFTNYRD